MDLLLLNTQDQLLRSRKWAHVIDNPSYPSKAQNRILQQYSLIQNKSARGTLVAERQWETEVIPVKQHI